MEISKGEDIDCYICGKKGKYWVGMGENGYCFACSKKCARKAYMSEFETNVGEIEE